MSKLVKKASGMRKVARKFYNAPLTISYNADMTLIVTLRSYGKTYGFTKEAIKDYMRDKSQFVWVRRYGTELDICKTEIFTDIIAHNEFPGYEFKVDGDKGYVRKRAKSDKKEDQNPWDVICHFMSLSQQANYKGKPFPRVKKIIFDEFIRVLRTPPGYLRDDVGAFLDLIKTVSRDREGVHAYLLGNACDLVNPYFTFLGIYKEPREGYTWYKDKHVLVHYAMDEVFADQERDTIAGHLVAGTAYEDVMINNIFANAGDDFIAKKTKGAKFRYGMEFQGERFGIWVDLSCGLYFVCRKIPKDGRMFVLSAQDMRPNLIMIDRVSPFAKSIVRLFQSGCVRFDYPATREAFLRMLNLCGLR